MAKKTNLSDIEKVELINPSQYRVAVLTSMWNNEVTSAMESGAVDYLRKQGFSSENINIRQVPGSYELPLAAQMMLETHKFDGIVCLGCVIQGETRHFEFISQAVAQGIMDINLKYNTPVSFGVLTTDTHQQAIARAGGKHGNKGEEAAAAMVAMLKMKVEIFQ